MEVDLSYPASFIKERCFICSHSLPPYRNREDWYQKRGNSCRPCDKAAEKRASWVAHEREQDRLYPLREREIPEVLQNTLKAAFVRIRLKNGEDLHRV